MSSRDTPQDANPPPAAVALLRRCVVQMANEDNNVLGDRPVIVDVQLTSLRHMLDTIRVTAKRLYASDVSGFEHRRTTGFGHFFDSADVERLHPFETTRILQGINGIRLAGTGANLRILTGNVNLCEPTVL